MRVHSCLGFFAPDSYSDAHTQNKGMHMRRDSRSSAEGQAGFTLIELMITVVIVAILAAVALPAYGEYIRRGQLPEAFTRLADYHAKLEQYYQDNRNYGSGGVCANAAGTGSWNTFTPTGNNNFTYECVPGSSGQQYTLRARGSVGRVIGHHYTINQNGTQATERFKGTTLSPAAACWLTRSATC
jgi:type IV pilus assembly protein PilE